MRALTRATAVLSGVALGGSLAGWAVGGCSIGGGGDEDGLSGGPKREIAAAVHELERATARGEFEAVCDDLFTAGARRQAGGRQCAKFLASSARNVSDPRIELLEIRLRGGAARVRVRATARDRPPVDETIEFVRERGRYRIAALAG
jgi:hypothetical protein